MSTTAWLVLMAVLVLMAGITALVLLKLPMRRPEGNLHDREQWFAQARTARGVPAQDGEPAWDGKIRRPNLEGESGAGLI